MSDSPKIQLNEKVDSLWGYTSSLRQSIHLLRFLGYGLLILASLDLLQIFIPPDFTNPGWEFELVGQLVERVAVPLIGLGLVLMGQQGSRSKKERIVLKTFSWLSLVVAILFVLLVPLNIVSTVRIHRQSNERLTAQVNQAKSQLQEAQSQLGNVGTLEQAEQFLVRLDPQRQASDLQGEQTLEDFKEKMTLSFSQGERKLKNQAAAVQKNQLRTLLKNSFKWNLGAIVSSALFFSIWRSSSWARVRR